MPLSSDKPLPPFDIVCLTVLKWEDTLFQRPQQLMKRMAQSRRVLYVANCPTREFIRAILRGRTATITGRHGPNLRYLNVPFLPFTKHSRLMRSLMYALTAFIAAALARLMGLRPVCLWLYYPPYVDYARWFRPQTIVYDCMDLFRGFQASDPGIEDKERRLIARADAVFTGGRSLQRDKEGVNPRTWCFPSGVEFEHFNRAADAATPIPADIASIPHPILGYFGAVDERIDFDLLRQVCEARPDWSVVLIGPRVAGQPIPFAAPNFHCLGPRRYADLPAYLKAFDVCLMPFVSSELTRHISPTKTPEYLSGGKPVVSTPVPDVVADYGDVVAIAPTHETFIEALEAALADDDPGRAARFRERAEAQSWDRIAAAMLDQLA